MGEETRTIPKCEGISPLDQALSSPNFSYYEHLRALLCSYLPETAIALIDRTFYVADVAHREQKRASGEPYIIHPIAVATVIAQMHLDVESVQAALLHDVVEDTFITSKMLEDEFGPTVNEIVEGVTKLDKLRFHDYKEAQMENFRKMILAMTKDIRVILIKLADRTHNLGGICIGEVTHRVSDIILDDRAYGFPRFLREAAATIINPIKGLNRIITGEAWRVRSTHYLHHDREAFPLDCSISVGDRYLADNGAIFRGEHNPYVNLFMEYGDAMDGENHNKPYDFFSAEVTFGLSKNQPIINSLHILGRLWSAPFNWGKSMDAEFGIYQHFNYYDSKPVKNGSDLTPYRISEAASVGPGVIVEFPKVGALTRLEQRIFLSGILLGGTKSDYFNVIDRDYNMGSGYSIKTKTHMEIGRFGRFILNVHYFRIFTWKGYENKDLSTIDPLYLNAQGDKGNARLLVVSPMIEIDLPKRWSLLMASSFFERQTHYKYYADVKTKTFEVRAGLTYHF